MFLKFFFPLLFLLQLICTSYFTVNKDNNKILGDISTKEGLIDFSIEDGEGEVEAEFYLIDNKNSSSNYDVCDVYQQTIYLSHNNQIPKPVYLEIPYSPPEQII